MSKPASASPAPLHDLEALRRKEEPVAAPRRRGWLLRLTGLLVVIGVLGVAWAVLSPYLFPPRAVRIVPVRVLEEGGTTVRGRVVAEAAGWIEADPFPVTVRPLVKGVIASLDVLEGQSVTGGETVIARLRNVDLENELLVARSTLALRESELTAAKARLAKDRSVLDQRLAARELQARYEGEHAVAEAAHAEGQARLARAVAGLATAEVDLRALEDLEGAGSATPLALARARAKVEEARSAVEAERAGVGRLEADLGRLAALVAIAREGVGDPRGLEGDVLVDEALVGEATAARDLAQTRLTVAEANVDLLVVRAPMDGIVLRLESAPGSVAGPQGEMRAGAEEGTGSTGRLGALTGGLVSIYHPRQLQARVDVRLEEVGGIGAGTKVEIEVDALRGRTFHGVVDRLQHEADLLKNTLQVKVEIEDPDPLLRPEMLVRARFLAAEGQAVEASADLRVMVPAAAVRDGAVMVFDPTAGGRARRVPVEVVGRDGDQVVVEGPLGPGHKVILDPVADGERVKEMR